MTGTLSHSTGAAVGAGGDGPGAMHEQLLLAVRARPEDVTAVLLEVSTLLVDEVSLEERLERIVRLAVRTVRGCDEASITLRSEKGLRTLVPTDERTLAVDRAQYDAGEGPCLTAMETGSVVLVDDVASEERWPLFTAAAREAGLRSFLASPLVVGAQSLGALNLFSSRDDGFDALDEAFVALLSGQAAASIANAMRYEDARTLAEQLDQAMLSRAVIEQAKGMLMARHGLDADGAFDLLRRRSQHANEKLRDVARQVVESARSGGRGAVGG